MIARYANANPPIGLRLTVVFLVGTIIWLHWKFIRDLKARPALWKKMGEPDNIKDSYASFSSKVISGLLLKERELSDLSPDDREFLGRYRWPLILSEVIGLIAFLAIVMSIGLYAK